MSADPTSFYNAETSRTEEPAGGWTPIRERAAAAPPALPTGRLPAGPWRVRWQTPLSAGCQPRAILHVPGRILIDGQRSWQLLDAASGQSLRTGIAAPGEFGIDARAGLFCSAEPSGKVSARRLADGSLAWEMFAFSGSKFRRSLLALDGARLIVLSEQMRRLNIPQPDLSVLELYDVANPAAPGLLCRLVRTASPTPAALYRGGPVVVLPNRVFVFDAELKLLRGLDGDFEPLVFRCDSLLRMAVRSGGKVQLWLVTLDGALLARAGLPFEPAHLAAHGDRTWLAAQDRILAVDAHGKELWSATGAVAGIAAAGDSLLAAIGSKLIACAEDGIAATLYESSDGALRPAPLLTVRGELLVADATHLLCLAAE